MNTSGLRFLRPYLCKDVAVSSKSAYVRFFNTTRRLMEDKLGDGSEYPVELMVPFQVRERVKELKKANSLEWPRIARDLNATSLRKFKEEFGHILPGDRLNDVSRTLQGRVRNVRKAGKGLVFIDIDQDRYYTQLVLNHISMEAFSGTSKKNFADLTKVIKRGDIISCTGTPFSNKSGQLCLAALDICTLLSPSLESLPFTIKDREMRIRNRHVDFLTNSTASNTIKARSKIIQNIRDFLLKDDFLEVQTPILADKAGGAVAKPFGTQATEFPEKQLALRIAPELWLKRLIIGGMDRVFEIGPSFRNEGLDGTHNPEFTTCEFYKSFAELEELIQMTENLFAGLSKLMIDLKGSSYKTLPELDATLFVGPFKRISFIPAIEEGLKQKLPDLSSATAEEDLVTLFQAHDIPLPASPTLPRLLDKLSSIYIEPECVAPTFITYHPACMAPLSKSFFDEATKQYVSARAELFIEKKEIANMYEEENSPFAQRKKFMEQIKWRDDENSAVVDESYLEALEWGMPPTGGWGMGVDRLIMLLTGATRISDVLAFGSLRNVVNLGSIGSEKLKPSKEATKNIFEEMGGE